MLLGCFRSSPGSDADGCGLGHDSLLALMAQFCTVITACTPVDYRHTPPLALGTRHGASWETGSAGTSKQLRQGSFVPPVSDPEPIYILGQVWDTPFTQEPTLLEVVDMNASNSIRSACPSLPACRSSSRDHDTSRARAPTYCPYSCTARTRLWTSS